jgi:hypothetical protein
MFGHLVEYISLGTILERKHDCIQCIELLLSSHLYDKAYPIEQLQELIQLFGTLLQSNEKIQGSIVSSLVTIQTRINSFTNTPEYAVISIPMATFALNIYRNILSNTQIDTISDDTCLIIFKSLELYSLIYHSDLDLVQRQEWAETSLNLIVSMYIDLQRNDN